MSESTDAVRPTARQERAEEMKRRLLDAAYAVYAKDGDTGLTNRRIAAEADTTTQAIYTYFGSRDALVEEMRQEAVRSVEEVFATAVEIATSDAGPEARVDTWILVARGYREFCLANPAQFRMLLGLGGQAANPLQSTELRGRMFAAVLDYGRAGRDLDHAWFAARVRVAIAAVHGFILSEQVGFIRPEHDPDQMFVELVRRMIVDGEDPTPAG